MNKKFKVILLGFMALALFLSGCTSDEVDVMTEGITDQVESDDETEHATADGYSLKVETLGHVHWDGTQISVSTLGLEAGNIYEFLIRVMIPNTPDGGIGLLLQGNEPNWTMIATTGALTGSDSEWHTVTGTLDLSNTAEIKFTYIQLVKDTDVPNSSVNTIFLLDEFIVTRDCGTTVASIDFADGRKGPFVSRGHVLLSLMSAETISDIEFANPVWDLDLPSLAEIYADYFLFGNILEPALIENNPSAVIDMFLHQYNTVTAENAMKPEAVSGGGGQTTRPDSLHLSNAETMVTFAEDHDLFMVGHTLIWHEQSSLWQYRDPATGDFLTRAEAMENMRWFIQQYAGHFEGRIDVWDVTNEVFTNNGSSNNPSDGPDNSPVYDVGTWQRALRNYASWYHAFANGAEIEAGERGWDYIYYAFVFTRRYAPSATLIYNDFNEEIPTKRDAIANMVEDLNERWANDPVNNPAFGDASHPDYGRLLIEAIGMQAHYNQGTNLNHVHDALERFIQTGARIHVTELDIQFTMVINPFELTDAQLEQQADMFAQLFVWYMEYSDYIDRVSIWGREDGSSWRGSNGATHFDRHFQPKPAFWAIVDPVDWLTERGLME